jgi:hypothetical protein
MIRDTPTISNASHSNTVYGLNNLAVPLSNIPATTSALSHQWLQEAGVGIARQQKQFMPLSAPAPAAPAQPKPKKENPVSRRLVQVFIADPDENLPLEQSMLYTGEQKLTDATDQELFFEVDMKEILANHNENRVKIINKKVKERTEYLEPAKIRDLKMVVVNVATF